MGLHVEEGEEGDDSPPASPPSFSLPTSPLPLTSLQGETIGGLKVKAEVEDAPDQLVESGSQKPFSFGVDFLLGTCASISIHIIRILM